MSEDQEPHEDELNDASSENSGDSGNGKEIDERMHWVNNNQDSVFYDYKKYNCLDEFRTNFAVDYLDKK